MRRSKNCEITTPEAQELWDREQDLTYFNDHHSPEEGTQDRHGLIIECIQENFGNCIQTLDRAIGFLWKKPHDLDEHALTLMPVEEKIGLLRKLIVERSLELPVLRRLDYVNRFEEDFDNYSRAERYRSRILLRYMVEPSNTWLRELVDLDDLIATAWLDFDESMSCEHEGFVRLLALQCADPPVENGV